MSTNTNYSSGFSLIIKRALEGRITPLNFLLVLGFFSSLVLFYISLHVYLFTVSKDLNTSRERRAQIMDQNVRLSARYNDLVAPEHVIPIVEKMGLTAGSPDDIERLALYELEPRTRDEASRVARGGDNVGRKEIYTIDPESR